MPKSNNFSVLMDQNLKSVSREHLHRFGSPKDIGNNPVSSGISYIFLL
jgi:hypothetical protein